MSSLMSGSVLKSSLHAVASRVACPRDCDLGRSRGQGRIAMVKKYKSRTSPPPHAPEFCDPESTSKNEVYFPLSHVMQDSVMSNDPNLLSLFMSLPSSKRQPQGEASAYARNDEQATTSLEIPETGTAPQETAREEKNNAGAKRGSRFPQFTAEKAKLLRETLKGSYNWHDTMYHSGIASRLALEPRGQ